MRRSIRCPPGRLPGKAEPNAFMGIDSDLGERNRPLRPGSEPPACIGPPRRPIRGLLASLAVEIPGGPPLPDGGTDYRMKSVCSIVTLPWVVTAMAKSARPSPLVSPSTIQKLL